MNLTLIDLSEEQYKDIECRLEDYDEKHIKYNLSGDISIGVLLKT